MTRAEALRLLAQHLSLLRERFGVRRLALFGSVARDEASVNSDIDLLVDFGQAPSFDQYMGTLFYLEDLFHRRVDLVTVGGLRPELRPHVEADALEVADAA